MPSATLPLDSWQSQQQVESRSLVHIKPDMGPLSVGSECTRAIVSLAQNLVGDFQARGVPCLPNPLALSTVLNAQLEMTAWSLPSFIHTCEIKGTWNRKGLRLQLTDLHHDRRLLDYRIKSDGTAEGHFGKAPDTHRSVLLLGSQSARNQILTGTWHYTGGREPVVQFFNGQAWVPDPDQTKRYRRLIKDFPSAVDRTHA